MMYSNTKTFNQVSRRCTDIIGKIILTQVSCFIYGDICGKTWEKVEDDVMLDVCESALIKFGEQSRVL